MAYSRTALSRPGMRGALVLIVLALLLPARPAKAEVLDRIVAVVNGEIITLHELDKRFKPIMLRFKGQELSQEERKRLRRMKRDLLDRMVNEMLLVQEGERLGITVSDSEVDSHLERLKQQKGLDQEELKKQLAEEGLTLPKFREKLREDIITNRLVGSMVRRKVAVTTQEIEAFYEEHKERYTKQRSVGLRIILLPDEKQAETLRERIVSGDMTFAEAAEAQSIGPAAESGGDIGVLQWSELAPEWKDALAGKSEGDVSRPFAISGKGALLKVTSDSAGQVRPLEEVREEIRDELAEPRFDELYQEYLQRLRKKAILDIRL